MREYMYWGNMFVGAMGGIISTTVYRIPYTKEKKDKETYVDDFKKIAWC